MQLKDISFAKIQSIAIKQRQSTVHRKVQITEPEPTGYKPQLSYEQFVAKENRKQYAKNRKLN